MKNDDAYANAAYVPDAEDICSGWVEDAEDYRMVEAGIGRAKLGISYGIHPRQRYDLFLPDGKPHGVVVFVHGGYWRMLDRSYWSHFAECAQAMGWAVAFPEYVLAPEVKIPEITKMIATVVDHVAGEVDGPIILTGHSAGGHLVARMAMADTDLSLAVKARIQKIIPISPLSDLRPLIETQMNKDFGLDDQMATAESPALHSKDLDVPIHIWVGGDERPAFLDQARWLASAWACNLTIESGRHHFNIIDGLREPKSPLMKVLLS